MILSTKISTANQILVLLVLIVQIFNTFTLQPAFFEFQFILREEYRMTNEITLNPLRSKITHICSSNAPELQTSTCFTLRQVIFDVSQFQSSQPNDPKMTLNIQGQRFRILSLTISVSLYKCPLSRKLKLLDSLYGTVMTLKFRFTLE